MSSAANRFKNNFLTFVIILTTLFLFFLPSITSAEGEVVDYSDAPPSYGLAWHKAHIPLPSIPKGFIEWLGSDVSNDTVVPTEDTFDDGVTWAPLTVGKPFDLTFQATFSTLYDYNEYVNVDAWIDFNQNGQFENTEKAMHWYGQILCINYFSPTIITKNLAVPASAKPGNTWLRVRLWWLDDGGQGGEDLTGSADGEMQWGEVEDYPINIAQDSDIDTTGPQTKINQAPPAYSNNPNQSFSYSATDNITPPDKLQFATMLESKENTYNAFTLDTTKNYTALEDGTYTFNVKAKDEAGNEDLSPDKAAFTIDTIAPQITIDTPINNQRINNTFKIKASANDNILLDKVEFYIDDNLVQSTIEPFEFDWNSTSVADGSHLLKAIAYDKAGNKKEVILSIIVDNILPRYIKEVPVGKNPRGVGVNPLTNEIYIANFADNNVSVIDGNTDSLITTIPAGERPLSVAVNPYTNKIYVANDYSSNISVIDGATKTVSGNIALSSTPKGIAINPYTNKLYATILFEKKISVIDTKTNTVINDIISQNYPFAICVNTNTNKIYSSDWNMHTNNSVSVIDGQTDTLQATIPANIFGVGDISVNIATNRFYLTGAWSQPDNKVEVFDGNTNTLINEITVITNPSGLAPNHLANRLYVANNDSDDVTFVDTAADSVLETIGVGTTPKTIGVNLVTNKIYAANYDGDSVSVIEDIPALDTQKPTVKITSAANNSDVSGNVSIESEATDDLAVLRVEFYVDNILKNTDTTYPFSYNWDSTLSENGSHTIKAVAYDIALNNQLDQISVNTVNAIANLILNPSFEDSANNNNLADNWSFINTNQNDGRNNQFASNGLFSLKITGQYNKNKRAAQTIFSPGKANDIFTISGNNKTVNPNSYGGDIKIVVIFNNTDSSKTTYNLPFNKNNHNWIFKSKTIKAVKDYSSIEVRAAYNRQTGITYFDSLSLIK